MGVRMRLCLGIHFLEKDDDDDDDDHDDDDDEAPQSLRRLS